MNPTAEEIKSYIGCSEWDDDFIAHYGKGHLDGGHSGRYPWGSGEEAYQHGSKDFLGRIEELKKKGWVENAENIKKEFGVSMKVYRYEKTICTAERRRAKYDRACELRDQGLNTTQIGKKMGINESSVRSLFDEAAVSKMNEVRDTADFLKKQIKEKKMIDVGKDVELELGISRDRLDTALYYLKGEGYGLYPGRVPQPTNKNQATTQVILAEPGIPYKDSFDFSKVKTITEYKSEDGGKTFKKFQYPESLDSKRLMIKYAEDGGADKDGVIELRPGCPDLSLRGKNYAQVRIAVDGTHYLKGMAVYNENLPDGVDVLFNSNKSKSKGVYGSLKEMKSDPENPFGSLIKPDGQYYYDDPKTGKKKLGLINERAGEGDWSEWNDSLPSQFLAKQSQSLAKKQLNLAIADKQDEYQSIMSITNGTIRKHYLAKFASTCDSTAESLSAAALPGQKYHVLLPVNSLKPDEIYAPRYADGTKLALVRFPHAGAFETPILTVNNRNREGRKVIGTDAGDAVGIHHSVAGKLSGADFDGDTVMCIPTHDPSGKVKIISRDSLPGLKGFDTNEFVYHELKVDKDGTEHYFRNGNEFKPMTKQVEQTQMGIVSNLIMDMTLGGASPGELERAVKHSMVVIDAKKHKLDWKQSEKDNKIQELRDLYQIQTDANGNIKLDKKGNVKTGGTATLLTRAGSEERVTKRQGSPRVNLKGKSWYDPTKPEGSLLYKDADDATFTKKVVGKDGKEYEEVITKHISSTKMAETTDAYTLLSSKRHPMEILYADYANTMKDMANKARVELANTEGQKKNALAAKQYAPEVASLTKKLNEALKNSIKERQALRLANSKIKEKKLENPELEDDKESLRKVSQQSLTAARADLGSKNRKERNIVLSDREWEAIQKGAITENVLTKILNNTDPDDLRRRATNKTTNTLPQATINHIKAMASSNYTLDEIAEYLDISSNTVAKYLKKG